MFASPSNGTPPVHFIVGDWPGKIWRAPLVDIRLAFNSNAELLNLIADPPRAARDTQLNSIHAFSTGLTPTGGCTLLRYVFLMCNSIFARTCDSVSFATVQCLGVSGLQRIMTAAR
jgi:hypothetical protein